MLQELHEAIAASAPSARIVQAACGTTLCRLVLAHDYSEGQRGLAQQIAAIGGPFKLTDQNGQTVTDQDLKGRPFLVFFGFTHCPDVCPTTLFEVSEILRALGPDGSTGELSITGQPALAEAALEAFSRSTSRRAAAA